MSFARRKGGFSYLFPRKSKALLLHFVSIYSTPPPTLAASHHQIAMAGKEIVLFIAPKPDKGEHLSPMEQYFMEVL